MVAAGSLGVAGACGSSDDGEGSAAASDASTTDVTLGDAEVTDVVLGPPIDAALPRPPSRIWAHTATDLYRFDPEAKTLTRVGAFAGLDTTPIDLAEARDGGLFVTTFTGLYRVNPSTAAATRLSPDSGTTLYPNSLAFVPAGTLDPNDEALVGYVQSDGGLAERYVRIDTTTGAVTDVGDLNAPDAAARYTLSGDVVSLARQSGRTFVTAYQAVPPRGPDASFDELVEVDPKTGRMLAVAGGFREPFLWGLGYWSGTFYGFAMNGDVVAFPLPAGSDAGVVASIADTDGGRFFGAGITSDSPLTP